MRTIQMTLANGNTRTLSARSIDAPMKASWGYGIVLRQAVTLDDTRLPEGSDIEFGDGTVCTMEDGQTLQGRVTLFAADEDAVSIRIFTARNQVPMLQSDSGDSDNIGAFSGSIGPFGYMVDINLDMENPMESQFIVELSCMGMKLADVHMDAQHPTASIGTKVFGVGVVGTIGVDFTQQRVYASITLGYFIGEKQYDFDLYHWGNVSVQMRPMVQSAADSNNNVAVAMNALQSNGVGGSITMRNNSGYVAKFKIAFTLNGQRIEKETENFTAGVNKQIDIPVGATDIRVEALAAWFICSWSSIFTEHFDTPVCKNYELLGTSLNPYRI